MHLCAESRAGKQDTRPGFGLRQKIPAPVQLGPNLPTQDRESGPRHTKFQNTCATLHGPRCCLAAAEATAVGTLPHTSPLTPGPPVTCSCASSPPDLPPSHARSVASRTAGHGGTPLLCALTSGMEMSQPPRNRGRALPTGRGGGTGDGSHASSWEPNSRASPAQHGDHSSPYTVHCNAGQTLHLKNVLTTKKKSYWKSLIIPGVLQSAYGTGWRERSLQCVSEGSLCLEWQTLWKVDRCSELTGVIAEDAD
ncbi:uncharacterized protein LOC128312979 [Acinonyx jubatus]|uniref:Uncharacterized protein LOC128312979 n=1 Tax=Acinonyx jubatus TaxID=32536 RepID=A0ABM3P0B8_ACIJB|nr:uncharacterized protein LOC128312979 [Acinonyx jubatus]